MPKTKPGYYAVRKGRKTEIYLTWDECKVQVNKFSNTMYKKFPTRTEAQNFIEGKREVSVILNDSKIQIWTDRSSFNNSTTRAQAGIEVFWKDDDPNNLSERLPRSEQTNNRAEIYSVIRALEVCENKTKPLEIMTDSKYVINIIEDWVEKWEKNGYMSYNNIPIKNQDLIKRLKKFIDNRIGTVRLIHIRGYWGNYGNEQADRLAKHGSLQEARQSRSRIIDVKDINDSGTLNHQNENTNFRRPIMFPDDEGHITEYIQIKLSDKQNALLDKER
ncbi:17433_t:CDS:2 [Racocetra persica]|uniref:17433_t:CDS:1 n=1 Tax=Racocetra persica TaxID=160502 RepID=A0ACA9PF59_9GLOM|nr:17433_t:CDS:2 [Racocetra persica]